MKIALITMSFIKIQEGCGNIPGCFGPSDSYITIFDSQLRHLIIHLIFSLFAGLIFLSILYNLKKRNKLKLSLVSIILLSIILTIFLFFILVLIFPVRVLY